MDNGFLSEASDLCAHLVLVTKPRRGPEVGVPGHVTMFYALYAWWFYFP